MGTLLLGVLLGGAITFLNQTNTEEEQETEIEDSREVFENDSRSAFFSFYIEKPDCTAFGNQATMDQLFNLDSLYEKAMTETNINIEEIKEAAEEKEISDFSPVKVKVNGDSNIFVAIFETGNNKENLNLAGFYYNYLFNSGFNILDDHKVYSLVEPELVEDIEEEEEAKTVQTQKSKSDLIKNVITSLGIGFVLAIVLTIGIMLIKELTGKKLNFIFSYNAEDFDSFMIYDKNLNNEKSIQYYMNKPSNIKKLILIEKEFNKIDKDLLLGNSNASFDIHHSIENTSTSNDYDEIIVIVKASETTRKWYNKQKELIELSNVYTKIIQFNKSFDTNDKR